MNEQDKNKKTKMLFVMTLKYHLVLQKLLEKFFIISQRISALFLFSQVG